MSPLKSLENFFWSFLYIDSARGIFFFFFMPPGKYITCFAKAIWTVFFRRLCDIVLKNFAKLMEIEGRDTFILVFYFFSSKKGADVCISPRQKNRVAYTRRSQIFFASQKGVHAGRKIK